VIFLSITRGAPGELESVEVDTAHFMGNFPESCELHALNAPKGNTQPVSKLEDEWTEVLPRTKLGPHRRQFFHLENVAGRTYTHVKLTIYPDGGVKRVRVIGKRAEVEGSYPGNVDPRSYKNLNAEEAIVTAADGSSSTHDISEKSSIGISSSASVNRESDKAAFIQALPLTPEAFFPFGQVVQAYTDPNGAPRGTRITSANQGTATKFHKLASPLSSYPPGSGATTGLSVYRCQPVDLGPSGECKVSVLERHPYTDQALIPMGCASDDDEVSGEALRDSGKSYLVVVAKNGTDDGPDLGTLRAFIASAGQSVVYNAAVWRE
jgi:allantoicase